jgi:hypothetical protein
MSVPLGSPTVQNRLVSNPDSKPEEKSCSGRAVRPTLQICQQRLDEATDCGEMLRPSH